MMKLNVDNYKNMEKFKLFVVCGVMDIIITYDIYVISHILFYC